MSCASLAALSPVARRDERVHELQRGFRRLGHLVFQLPGGEVGIAEQLALLRAQLRDLGDGRRACRWHRRVRRDSRSSRRSPAAWCDWSAKPGPAAAWCSAEGMTKPSTLRPLAALGRRADICTSLRPARAALSLVTKRRFLGRGQQLGLELTSRGWRSARSASSARSCRRSLRLAPACTNCW